MSRVTRVLTGALMLVVLLGLPMAPVWCDLACPQANEAAVVEVTTAPPCHEASTPAPQPSSRPEGGPTSLAPIADAGCMHPAFVAATRLGDVRVHVEPPALVWLAGALATLGAPATWHEPFRTARGPAPPRGPAFSPVLRI